MTSGDAPPNTNGNPAEVVDDAMYIMTSHKGQMTLYALDLHHWRWTKLIPQGTAPLKGTNFYSTWQYGGKIYYFGGQTGYKDAAICGQQEPRYPEYVHVGWCTNQLLCYNIADNCWEWPSFQGTLPLPRFGHATIVSGDTVYLFGGRIYDPHLFGSKCLNDLHALDMVNMEWRLVHGHTYDADGTPPAREFHTLTVVSDTHAVLFGGRKEHLYRGDCWILDMVNAKEPCQENPSSIWTKCLHHGRPYCKKRDGETLQKLPHRGKHSAVMEPYSKRIWIIGGVVHFGLIDEVGQYNAEMEYTSDMLVMSFDSSTPLRQLALEKVIHCLRDVPNIDGLWMTLEIPEALWNELNAQRLSMDRERHTGVTKPNDQSQRDPTYWGRN